MSDTASEQPDTPVRRWKVPVRLLAVCGALAGSATLDYSCNEKGPTRVAVAEIREQCALLIGEPAAVRRKWIPQLAEASVEVALAADFFTPEEKQVFADRLARCSGEEEYLAIVADVDAAGTKVYSSEVSKRLPPGFHSDRDAVLHHAATQEVLNKYPQMRRAFELGHAADCFRHFNNDPDNRFRISSKEMVKRCEMALRE